MASPAGDITLLLAEMAGGDQAVASRAASQLVPLVYPELRRLAAGLLKREKPGHSLQSSDLISQAYLRLLTQRDQNYENRSHFFGVAAHLMRLILVDHARARQAKKRDGGARLDLTQTPLLAPEPPPFLLELHEALKQLAERSPRQCQIVEMRFFAGMEEAEIAAVLGISRSTVKRDWVTARTFLYQHMSL